MSFHLTEAGVERVRLPYVCDFKDSDVCGITQREGDDFDWIRISGATPSGNTGPQSAAKGTYYMFTEASNTKDNDKA